jgi:hypothetical protein
MDISGEERKQWEKIKRNFRLPSSCLDNDNPLKNQLKERFRIIRGTEVKGTLSSFFIIDLFTTYTSTMIYNSESAKSFRAIVEKTASSLEQALLDGDQTANTPALDETKALLKLLNETSDEMLMDCILGISYYPDNMAGRRPTFGDVYGSPYPLLKSTRPKNAVINNSNLVIKLTEGSTGHEIIVDDGSRRKPLSVFATLNYDDESLTFSGRQPFTAYDRAVHNAVCTLYEAGNTAFTPEMVYRAMNGLTNTERVSPQSVGAVTRSIEKSRSTKLTIEYTEEARRRNPDIIKTTIDDMLLSVQKITVTIPGCKEPKDAYQFNSKPILYQYSQSIGKVITIPIKLLKTGERTTEDVIVLREYLLRRIEGMKSKKQSNEILYTELYQALGLDSPDKHKALKIREHAKDLLHWWRKEDYIKNYIDFPEDKKIKKGLRIIL